MTRAVIGFAQGKTTTKGSGENDFVNLLIFVALKCSVDNVIKLSLYLFGVGVRVVAGDVFLLVEVPKCVGDGRELVGVVIVRLAVRLILFLLGVFDTVYYLDRFLKLFARLLHNKAAITYS